MRPFESRSGVPSRRRISARNWYSSAWPSTAITRPRSASSVNGSLTAIGVRRTPNASVALDVDELAQRVADLDERVRVLDHVVDVLVGGGDLVEQHPRAAELDPLHRHVEVLHREELARLRPRVAAAGAV